MTVDEVNIYEIHLCVPLSQSINVGTVLIRFVRTGEGALTSDAGEERRG